jgi:hypothetical protein
MNSELQSEASVEDLVRSHFSRHGIRPVDIKIRSFPGERIVIVEVASQLERAMEIGNELDQQIENGFVTVRLVEETEAKILSPVDSVRDERVTRLIGLLEARSRTSEAQPSLRYIEDVSGRLQVAMAARHHLIFGRRGAGKSALRIETKTRLEQAGSQTLWLNIQTVRSLGASGAFLTLASRLCELPAIYFGSRSAMPQSVSRAQRLKRRIDDLLSNGFSGFAEADGLIPDINGLLRLYVTETQVPIYVFLDDVHYLKYGEGPDFLDRVHAVTRDNPVWLKIAGIRHQMRWFRAEPPTGMQLPHDAIEVNLDITLQEPERAKRFLQSVLDAFVEECDARPRRGFISGGALDRLVLASGAVPRDFVTLCATSIQLARKRSNARTTGVQDVNEAAGMAAKGKLQELEEDAAAALGTAAPVVAALQIVRDFCLVKNQTSFFGVDFLEKEQLVEEYALIQRLLDLRIVHLINGSLSAAHQVGHRSEVYLLDLSEYTGARLRQKLWVLDFEAGHLCLKRTRSTEQPRVGDTARRLVAILRLGPMLSLKSLSSVLQRPVAQKKPRPIKQSAKK